MFVILAILYPIAVQYERGGWWRLLAPITLVTLLIDVWCNYTELALLLWDHPQHGEHTFSQRLRRLQYDQGWRGHVALAIIGYLNGVMPDHIPA